MTCNVAVPMRLAHGPSSITWEPEMMHELTGVVGNITRNGNIFLFPLTFNQLTTDDAIPYYCKVNFQDFSVSSSATIILKVKSMIYVSNSLIAFIFLFSSSTNSLYNINS